MSQQNIWNSINRPSRIRTAWQIGSASSVRLSDDPFENVQIGENGKSAFATDEAPYAREVMSGRAVHDLYRVDVATGRREKLLTKSPFGATASPSVRPARSVS